ncbi:MAG: hypothetical protein IKL59_08470 [Clostridia bacterium]|nr:hypothetical protein [Clostridia bacterium]
MVSREKEIAELYARLDDICEVAARGEIGASQFMTEAECARSEAYLRRRGASFFFFGGYSFAERKRLYILPDYIEGTDTKVLCDYGYSSQIKALAVCGSGYSRLTHRDFLGSLLSLGLERSVIGDIVVESDAKAAVVFCDERIAPFICSSLERVGGDKVRVKETEIDESKLPERRFLSINTTVSSTRLDAVVSALCNLSRERASELVVGGMVDLNFETEEKPDKKVTPPGVVSVRGFGKYRLLCADTRTKKGKYRLEAQKYL